MRSLGGLQRRMLSQLRLLQLLIDHREGTVSQTGDLVLLGRVLTVHLQQTGAELR
jgi:hypothetical protein